MTFYGFILLPFLIGNLLPNHGIPKESYPQTKNQLWKTQVNPKILTMTNEIDQKSLS